MTDREERRASALRAIDEAKPELLSISHDIHGYAETAFQEFQSANRLREALVAHGFRVSDVKGLETAFIAEIGSGSPVIAFMAEYDALPGIGHACGHNIIASAAVGAAVGAASFIGDGFGTIRVMGTPAEEGGGGKIIMADNGLFQGVDAALIVHPSGEYMADDCSFAVQGIGVEYIGKAAHAASGPEFGINALAAAVELLVSINAFREHMTKEGRIHAIITDGGTASNIIPERAALSIGVRATTAKYLDELMEHVERRARAAAMATGCKCNITKRGRGCLDIRVNRELSRLFHANFESIGIEVMPRGDSMGSTDVGNVSHVVPTIQAYVGIGVKALHSVEFREAAISPIGDDAVIAGAKVMALTAADILSDEAVLAEIRRGFQLMKASK